jgi:hypothetical protein
MVSAAPRREAAFLAGEVLFVTGWSLMWASSLDLTPFVPISACIATMIIGLAVPLGFVGRTGEGLRALQRRISTAASRAAE